MRICLRCGIEFEEGNRKSKEYCSKKCKQRARAARQYIRFGKRNKPKKKMCEKCGIEYETIEKWQKYCSPKCSGDAKRKFLSIPDCLEDASRKLDKKIGYIRVYCPMHPMANTWGYVYEHRLIMESIVGRHLEKTEHVHHINGNRWDNRPENLQLLSASEHGKLKK